MSDGAPAAPAAPQANATPEAPAKPAEAKAPAPEVDDSEEYVIDGQKVRLSKAQRTLHLQKSATAAKRLQEATEKQKALDELERLLEEDPEEFFRRKGKDASKIFAAHLEKRARQELLTPEQRKLQEIEAERDRYRAQLAEREKREKEAAQAEIDQRNFAALEHQLIAAADKHGLESTPDVLDGLCTIALEFVEHGVSITAEEVAREYVRREHEQIEARDKKVVSKLEGKKLLAYLGDGLVAKVKAALAAADAESLKAIPAPQPRAKVPVKAHERTVKGYVRETDFDKKFLK